MKTFLYGNDANTALSVIPGGLLKSIVSDIVSHFQS